MACPPFFCPHRTTLCPPSLQEADHDSFFVDLRPRPSSRHTHALVPAGAGARGGRLSRSRGAAEPADGGRLRHGDGRSRADRLRPRPRPARAAPELVRDRRGTPGAAADRRPARDGPTPGRRAGAARLPRRSVHGADDLPADRLRRLRRLQQPRAGAQCPAAAGDDAAGRAAGGGGAVPRDHLRAAPPAGRDLGLGAGDHLGLRSRPRQRRPDPLGAPARPAARGALREDEVARAVRPGAHRLQRRCERGSGRGDRAAGEPADGDRARHRRGVAGRGCWHGRSRLRSPESTCVGAEG